MDGVRRFLFEDLDIRGALVALGNSWHEMTADRDYPPEVSALLGELVAAAVLIAGNLKTPGRIVLQLQGHGRVSLLVVECDEQLRVRGTARYKTAAVPPAPTSGHPPTPSPALAGGETISAAVPPAPTFRDLIGDGQLVMTLFSPLGDPWQSVVPLCGDSLSAAFEHYLAQSEQQATRVVLAADGDFAGGLFLQKLPDADARDADGWNRLMHFVGTIKPDELRLPAAQWLMRVFPEENVRLFDPRPVRYHCPRDEEKVLAMLKSLGRAEVEAALAETGELKVEDDICRQTYRFGADVVPRLFD